MTWNITIVTPARVLPRSRYSQPQGLEVERLAQRAGLLLEMLVGRGPDRQAATMAFKLRSHAMNRPTPSGCSP